MLFPRGVVEGLGPFDEDLVLGEFVDWMRIARDQGVAERHVQCVRFGDRTTRTSPARALIPIVTI
ncbi:hypothetical protein N9D66_02085 [Candidatus Nanopelagicales bacterium]|nr:hypothetical protein [Candidatus Nanopelagicales bacterium]